MTKLEKIGLDYILQVVIDAEMYFLNSNDSILSENEKDDTWQQATHKIKTAINMLTSIVNEPVSRH